MPETALDMVRLGIVAYGFYPSDEMERPVDLHRTMELKRPTAFIPLMRWSGRSICIAQWS